MYYFFKLNLRKSFKYEKFNYRLIINREILKGELNGHKCKIEIYQHNNECMALRC